MVFGQIVNTTRNSHFHFRNSRESFGGLFRGSLVLGVASLGPRPHQGAAAQGRELGSLTVSGLDGAILRGAGFTLTGSPPKCRAALYPLKKPRTPFSPMAEWPF